MTSVLLLGGGILAAVAFGLWVYLWREPAVPARGLLAGLRAALLALLVLLLWNPSLPWSGGGGPGVERVVLLDASLSMAARDSAGATSWEAALSGLPEDPGSGTPVLLFGAGVRAVGAGDGVEGGPADEASLLTPALERAAALGATEVLVLSDLRLDDPVSAARSVEELGLSVRFEDVGRPIRNAGLGEVRVQAAPEPGGTTDVEVLLHGEGGAAGDSVELAIRGDEGDLLALRRVSLPEAGRPERHALEVPVPEEGGRYRIRVSADLPGDGFPEDDIRVRVLDVDPDRAEILLLSFRPDWEPRFLLPVLEQVTGLDVRGYLALSGGRWLPMGREEEREGGTVDDDRVRARIGESGLLVLHGVHAGAPAWIQDALESSGRTLAFAADAAGARTVGASVASARTGEWYPSSELPPSPLAGDLAAAALDALPPLTAVLPYLEEGRVPLRVQRGRAGPAEAALVLEESEGSRRALVLAAGFWRWASREGAAREAYRRLWAGVAGWLLAADPGAGGPRIAPVRDPARRGRPLEWSVRGLAGDSLRLRVSRADSALTDTTIAAVSGPTLRTPALPPGSYEWEASAPGLADGRGAGGLDVSPYSDELLRRPMAAAAGIAGSGGEGSTGAGDRGGRPLRTHPAPYLVLLALLGAEWIGRRRQGLR